jgi:hypothetical protein
MQFAPINKLLQCCNTNCACTNSCNINSTNLLSTVSYVTVIVYYNISTVRIITSSFTVGSSVIFISLCTKSAVLFARNKHINCVQLSLIPDNLIIGIWYTIDGKNVWFVHSFSPYQSQSFP